jgi:hypothetical protein
VDGWGAFGVFGGYDILHGWWDSAGRVLVQFTGITFLSPELGRCWEISMARSWTLGLTKRLNS